MTYITVHVRDVKKARLLYELLRSMDFVDSVDSDSTTDKKDAVNNQDIAEEFFSVAGMWADRDIDLAWIRERAWPRQQR